MMKAQNTNNNNNIIKCPEIALTREQTNTERVNIFARGVQIWKTSDFRQFWCLLCAAINRKTITTKSIRMFEVVWQKCRHQSQVCFFNSKIGTVKQNTPSTPTNQKKTHTREFTSKEMKNLTIIAHTVVCAGLYVINTSNAETFICYVSVTFLFYRSLFSPVHTNHSAIQRKHAYFKHTYMKIKQHAIWTKKGEWECKRVRKSKNFNLIYSINIILLLVPLFILWFGFARFGSVHFF